MITEALLHFAWKYRLYDQQDIRLLNGDTLEVISPGLHNTNAGPDFNNARLKIAHTLWAGNVEIHIRSSDWHRHNHTSDDAYSNIILHVVNENDMEIRDRNNAVIPVLELKNILPSDFLSRWELLNQRIHPIPCSKLEPPKPFLLKNWLDRLLVERLESKANRIEAILTLTAFDWQEAFYIFLARSFGFNINALPFELLARSIPLSIVKKHEQSSFQLQALFFGQSGLLHSGLSDEFLLKLQEEYTFLKKKYKLQPLEGHVWKFLRLRPSNFPGIRIAQFANLMEKASSLFSTLMENPEIFTIRKTLDVSASGYWETHYVFDTNSPHKLKHLGNGGIDILIINAIVPFLFLYGKHRGNEAMKVSALDLMEQLKPEKNTFITTWNEMNIVAHNAADSQALIQLRLEYCDKGKCLDCALGHRLLKQTNSETRVKSFSLIPQTNT